MQNDAACTCNRTLPPSGRLPLNLYARIQLQAQCYRFMAVLRNLGFAIGQVTLQEEAFPLQGSAGKQRFARQYGNLAAVGQEGNSSLRCGSICVPCGCNLLHSRFDAQSKRSIQTLGLEDTRKDTSSRET